MTTRRFPVTAIAPIGLTVPATPAHDAADAAPAHAPLPSEVIPMLATIAGTGLVMLLVILGSATQLPLRDLVAFWAALLP